MSGHLSYQLCGMGARTNQQPITRLHPESDLDQHLRITLKTIL